MDKQELLRRFERLINTAEAFLSKSDMEEALVEMREHLDKIEAAYEIHRKHNDQGEGAE